jgi:LacI family transcriptional regulator, galactose operon repressor
VPLSPAVAERRPTLYDVAQHAGVSLATASRVVNGSERGVGPELSARVLRAAGELGYVPHGPAQALARASTSTVGVIVHDIADPYFTEIALGAMAVADDGARLVTICNTFGDPRREGRYVALLHAQRVSALVLAGSGYVDPGVDAPLAAAVRSFRAGGGRVAMVGRHAIEADSVEPDNRGGAVRLGRALADLGHRRVGVVTGPPGLTTTADRLAGLRATLDLDEDRIVPGDFGREGGARGAGVLLDRHGDLTAIVAFSDAAAIGALSVLRGRGIDVPRDVSLFGFDDVPAARDVTPALSTVRLPLRELGATAMRLALDGWIGAPRTTVLPTELVLRDSSGAPK